MSYDTRELVLRLHGGSYTLYLNWNNTSDARLVLLEDACDSYEYSKWYDASAVAGLELLGVDATVDPDVDIRLILFAALSNAIDAYVSNK